MHLVEWTSGTEKHVRPTGRPSRLERIHHGFVAIFSFLGCEAEAAKAQNKTRFFWHRVTCGTIYFYVLCQGFEEALRIHMVHMYS